MLDRNRDIRLRDDGTRIQSEYKRRKVAFRIAAEGQRLCPTTLNSLLTQGLLLKPINRRQERNANLLSRVGADGKSRSLSINREFTIARQLLKVQKYSQNLNGCQYGGTLLHVLHYFCSSDYTSVDIWHSSSQSDYSI